MKNEDEIKRVNEYVAQRFAAIEDKLKNISDIVNMVETLFSEVEKEFQIPFVWLTLIDERGNNSIIKAVKSSEKLNTRLNLIGRKIFEELLTNGRKPVLINSNLKPYYKLFPATKKYFVKSMAVVPLRLKSEIIGSWNNGDVSSNRYSPDMDTDILQSFADKISEKIIDLVENNG